jgi:hypothetical protein
MGTISLCFPERETEKFIQMLKYLREYYDEKINAKFGDKTFKWGDGWGRFCGKRYKIRRKRITDGFVIRKAIQQHWEEILRLRTIEKIKKEAEAEKYEYEPPKPHREEPQGPTWKKEELESSPFRKKKQNIQRQLLLVDI